MGFNLVEILKSCANQNIIWRNISKLIDMIRKEVSSLHSFDVTAKYIKYTKKVYDEYSTSLKVGTCLNK